MKIWDDEVVKELLCKLSDHEVNGLELAVKALREKYPKIDIYYSVLGNGATISIGNKSKKEAKGKPLFVITRPRKNKPACVKVRMDSKKDRERLANALGCSWSDISKKVFYLNDFPGVLGQLEEFLKDLDSSIDVVKERSNGGGYLPSDYQDFFKITDESERDEDIFEGARLKVFVNKYERSRKARTACIAEHGACCFFCKFDFGEKYGERYSNFIHVHHIIPISKVGERYKINYKNDLIPVCPNCHAVIHFGSEALSLDEAKKILSPKNTRLG